MTRNSQLLQGRFFLLTTGTRQAGSIIKPLRNYLAQRRACMWQSNANSQEAWVVDRKRNDLYVEEEPWNRDPTIDALATMVARKVRYLSSRLRTHTSTDAKHRPLLPMQSSSPKAAGM